MTSGYNHERAQFKQENNTVKKMLEKLLPKYGSKRRLTLQTNAIQECRDIVNNAEKFFPRPKSKDGKISQMLPWTIPNLNHEPAYFTITMMMQTIQYIPHEFNLLHRMIPLKNYSSVEYMPCYMLDLNHIALIKLDKSNSDIATYGKNAELYQKLIIGPNQYARLSSTGVLRYGSGRIKRLIDAHEYVKKCFNICYWCLPSSKNTQDSSCIHNLIYHRTNNIMLGGILRIRKTILRIMSVNMSNIRSMRPINSGPNIKYYNAKVMVLADKDGHIVSEKKNMLVEKNLARTLKQDNIINAIIVEQQTIDPKFSLIIGMTGSVIKQGNISEILGLVLWQSLQNIQPDSSITQAGKIQNISDKLLELFENNSDSDDIFYPNFAWQKMENQTT